LAANPGTQIAAATGGALASGEARERGAGPGLQFVADLGGAAAGGALVNVPQATANALRRFQVATPDQRAIEILTREAGPMGLDGQASRTQGVNRTLGEETRNPGIMALENNARAGYRAQFDPIDTRNNAARVARLETISGTEAQREAAETARDTATTQLRDKAFAEGRASQAQAAQAQQAADRADQQARALGLPEPSKTKPQAAKARTLPESDTLLTPRVPTAAEMQRAARIEEVPLDRARRGPQGMDFGRFDRGDHPGPLIEGYGDIPVAVRQRNGEYLIFDGNHRTAQAISQGRGSLRMHVIDAADFDPEAAGRAAARRSTPSEDEALLDALGVTPEPAAASQSLPGGKAALRASLAGEVASQGGRDAVQRSLRAVVRDLDAADDSVEGLYRVRKSINDMIEGKSGTARGYAKAATSELMDARAKVDAEIAKRAPTFAGYIEAFKQGSRPINRMQVGEALIEKGSASIRDESGIPRLTPGTFAKANDLDRIAQQATGFRKAKARDILSEQDIAEIAAIQDDLQRQFARQKSAAAGSQTFERGEVSKRIASRGLKLIPFKLGDAIQFLDDRATDRVKERLAYLIANPGEARRIAAQLPPADRAVLNKALLALTVRVGTQNEALKERP
jgi:hypothetical protein